MATEYEEVMQARTRRFARPARKLKLTAELFGKLLILSWARQHGKSDFADRDAVINELLSAVGTAPQSVRSVMHIEDRISGPSIAEYTEYMVAAQDDGLLKRYNPAYVRSHVEIRPDDAEYLLQSYKTTLPTNWLGSASV